MEIVRWGLIGPGDVAERKSGPAFNLAEGSRLAAVAARRPEQARDYAARHGVQRIHETIDGLLADPEIDAVYIATPPDAHESLTLKAAAAGKPVYVEKPMGRSAAECLRMAAACKEAGVELFVAYYRRRLPKFMKVKQLIGAGAIGRVRRLELMLHVSLASPASGGELPWRLRPEIAGPGGHLMDLGTHQVDLLEYLIAPVAAAERTSVHPADGRPVPDRIAATLRLEGGVAVHADWRFDADPDAKLDRTTIVGEGGSIAYSTFDDLAITLTNAGGDESFYLPNPKFVQEPMIQAVTRALLGREPNPCDGAAGARANQAIEWILAGL